MQSSSQITTTNLLISFYRPDALPVAQPTASKHLMTVLVPIYECDANCFSALLHCHSTTTVALCLTSTFSRLDQVPMHFPKKPLGTADVIFLQAGCHSCHPTVSKQWRNNYITMLLSSFCHYAQIRLQSLTCDTCRVSLKFLLRASSSATLRVYTSFASSTISKPPLSKLCSMSICFSCLNYKNTHNISQ